MNDKYKDYIISLLPYFVVLMVIYLFLYLPLSIEYEKINKENICKEQGFDGYKANELVKEGNIACYFFLEDNVTKQYVAVPNGEKQ